MNAGAVQDGCFLSSSRQLQSRGGLERVHAKLEREVGGEEGTGKEVGGK